MATAQGAEGDDNGMVGVMKEFQGLKDKLKGDMASIKNLGDRWGGSITAALFLQNFVGEDKIWAHLDIAGPALIGSKERHLAKGATGAGVPGLLRWLRDL